jgi:predicted XRE-type DNA-binding protein
MKDKEGRTKTAQELASYLGLGPEEGAEIGLRVQLNSKIIEVVLDKALTHEQVAKLGRTSRTRITAIMNRNTSDVSTDLMLRILNCLGYEATVKFRKVS